MEAEFLIAGGGLAGCCLAFELLERGRDVYIIDAELPGNASRVGAGSFHPLVPKKQTIAWKQNQLYPAIAPFYKKIEQATSAKFYYQIPALFVFETKAEWNDWTALAKGSVVSDFIYFDANPSFEPFLQMNSGTMQVSESGYLDMPLFVNSVHDFFKSKGRFIESEFTSDDCIQVGNNVHFKEWSVTEAVIFCDGFRLAQNKYFSFLPSQPIHGDGMLIEIADLPQTHIIHKGIYLVPLGNDRWYFGGSFLKDNHSTKIETEGLDEIRQKISKLLKNTWKELDYFSGVRLGSGDRRPLVGVHPHHSKIGVLNGLSTKGVSLMPWLALETANALEGLKNLDSEIDIRRFKRTQLL